VTGQVSRGLLVDDERNAVDAGVAWTPTGQEFGVML
jgi:hypothetical protein